MNSDGEISSTLDQRTLIGMYRRMVLVRALDERLWILNRQGKAAIVASSQGHEAAQIASSSALRKGQDLFYIYYRDLAVLLNIGMTSKEIMLGFLAKEGEPLSGARQFPTHGAYPRHGIVNLSNVVATQLPQAVGAALAVKMRGENTVVITYFGDGASSMGDTHESMNFACIHKLPVIFFCENNKYATSVPLEKQMAVESIASRAQAYGMPGLSVDGCDVPAVYDAVYQAASLARLDQGPTLIEAMVERSLPHTSDDDDTRYRSPIELEKARMRDPLKILKRHLMALDVLSEEMNQEFLSIANAEVDEATEYAEEAAYPSTRDFHRNVYHNDSGGASLL